MRQLLFLVVLCLVFTTGYCQLTNLDFEDWYSDSTATKKLYGWQHLSYDKGLPGSMIGTWEDSNAEHGLHALTISRWYGYIKDWVRQRAEISSRPSGISGHYKYIEDTLLSPYNTDSAVVNIYLTKWNTTSAINDTIGSGKELLSHSAGYTAFNCNIIYMSSSTPDSITIDILPTYLKKNFGMCKDVSGKCSYLTIDNLSVSAPTDVTHIMTAGFDIYPNPVKDKLMVRLSGQVAVPMSLCIMDVLGRAAFKSTLLKPSTELDLSGLKAGNYFLLLQDGNSEVQVKQLTKTN